MPLDTTILQLGQYAFSLVDLLIAGAMALTAFLLIAWVFAWQARRLHRSDDLRRAAETEFRLAELTGSLRHFTEQSQGAQAYLARAIDERLEQVGHRLGLGLSEQTERTSRSLSSLNERLAVIDSAQKNLTELSGEMVTLKDILSNKQSRGAYGQGRMEAIVRDGLPANAFSFQPTLSNGLRPDCLIRLPDSSLKLVIDAKFPLEAFNALKLARNDGDRRVAETRLRTDVLKHVRDISEKYLIAGETHETAVLFVPSESVYADIHERFEDVIQKAHRSRVIFASPNVLMLLIQTMQAVFKDQRLRDQAGLIKVEVSRLLEDVGRLKERIGDLQKHFGAASSDLDKLNISADKVARRGLRIESLDLSEIPEEAEAQRLAG